MHKIPSKVKKITVSTLTSAGIRGANGSGSSSDNRELDELVPGHTPGSMYTDADIGGSAAQRRTVPKSGSRPGVAGSPNGHHSQLPLAMKRTCHNCKHLSVISLLINGTLALIVFTIGIFESTKCPLSNHKLPHLMMTYGTLWFVKTVLDVFVKYEVKSDPMLFKLTYEKICYPIEITLNILFVVLCIYLYAVNGCLATVTSVSPIATEPRETRIRGPKEAILPSFAQEVAPTAQPLNGHHYGGGIVSGNPSAPTSIHPKDEDLLMVADEPRSFSCRDPTKHCLNKGACKAICTHYEHRCVCQAGSSGDRCQFSESEAASASEEKSRLGTDQSVPGVVQLEPGYDLHHQLHEHPVEEPAIHSIPQNDGLVPLVGDNSILAESGLQLIRDVRQEMKANFGSNIVLDCEPVTENLTFPITYMWYTVNKPMPSHIAIDGGRLKIAGVLIDDTARYVCEARNEFYRVKYTVDLDVVDDHTKRPPVEQAVKPHGGFEQVHCDHCLNGGKCFQPGFHPTLSPSIPNGGCDCPIGSAGPNCTEKVLFHDPKAAQFSGSSVIVLQIVNSLPLGVASYGHLVSFFIRTHERFGFIGQLVLDDPKFDENLHSTMLNFQLHNGQLLINGSDTMIVENQWLADGRLHSIDVSINSQLGRLEVNIDHVHLKAFPFVHPSPLYANLMNARSGRLYLGLEHFDAETLTPAPWYNGFKGCLQEVLVFGTGPVDFATAQEQGNLFVKEAWNILPCAMVIQMETPDPSKGAQQPVQAHKPDQQKSVINATTTPSPKTPEPVSNEEDYNADYDDTELRSKS